jgi:hypothetical protein
MTRSRSAKATKLCLLIGVKQTRRGKSPPNPYIWRTLAPSRHHAQAHVRPKIVRCSEGATFKVSFLQLIDAPKEEKA